MSPRLMLPAEIDVFFENLKKQNPDPVLELDYTNSYTLLVAVILSAQATDKGVNKATPALFDVVSTPQEMLDLGVGGLKNYIKTIGLFNSKARHIMAMSQQLVDHFGGEVPYDREALESLPGVGRKTANVMLNTLLHAPVIAVDTHVFRVANRTGLTVGKTPLAIENGLMKRIPEKWLPNASHWLVLLGRYTCKARKPMCPICPVARECQYPHKTPALP